MSIDEEDFNSQDKKIEKIHREEGLDEEDNSYNVSDSQSDGNQQDAEKDNTAT
jgi:hypothetical protein